MLKAHFLALLWAIFAWAIPSQSTSTKLAYPTLTRFFVSNLCWGVHKGVEAQHAAYHYLDSGPLDRGDDDSAVVVETGRDLQISVQTAVSRERSDSSKRPIYGKMIYRRSDDHTANDGDNNTEGNKQNSPSTEVAKTTTEASKPTETTDPQTTSKSEESHTKTKGESTASAAASVSSDDTTRSSTHSMSTTQVSTTSDTKPTSVTESGTSAATATSKASTTSSHASKTHTATTQAQQTSQQQFNEANYHKSSIAAGVVIGFVALLAFGLLLVMYLRKRMRMRKLLQDGSRDSALPLVESGGASRSATAQGHHSGKFDRESLMWAPAQSSMSFIPVAFESQQSRHETSPILTSHSRNDSGTTTNSHGSSSSNEGSEYRILTSPVPSVVVVPPSPSVITEIPTIPLAATGSGVNRDRTANV